VRSSSTDSTISLAEPRHIRVEDLPSGENSEVFNGHEQGASVSVFLSHNKPGTGPNLHKHPYEEIFFVQAGAVTFTVGDDSIDATAGDILIVPPDTPHRFECRSEGHRQVSIHPVPEMQTEWLE
jgi:quercetin dioxygenase-like cupin family protein